MAWLRFDDNWNQRPEIRALDDATFRAYFCTVEAAERFDCAGIVTDDYVMTVYPHGSRRKLRERIRKLVEVGIFHRLQSIDDHDPDCPTCEARMTEAGAEAVQKHVQNHPHSVATSARSSRTEVVVICIRHFYEVAMTPEKKREKRRKDAGRQQRKRDRDKADPSRRDAEPPSRPPVPVPVPKLKINDLPPPTKEREPTSIASPSTPSIGTADRDAVSWLRTMLDERWPNAKHWEHFDEIQRLAKQEPGDPVATLAVAMDAFDADTSQQKYRHSPQGLVMHWNRYVADHREQIKATEGKRRAAAAEQRHQKAKAAAEAEHWQKVQAKQQRGGKPLALAELMPSIIGGKG